MDEEQFMAARRVLSERTVDGKPLSAADLARMVEEEFDRSGLGDLLEKMTEQETIERAIIGKRVVAVSWLPASVFVGILNLESLTLKGGTVLRFEAMDTRDANMVHVEIEENEDANT